MFHTPLLWYLLVWYTFATDRSLVSLHQKLRLFIGVLSEASDMIHESCSAYVEHMYAQPSTIQCKSLYANYTCDSANFPCSSPFVVYRNCDTPVASKINATTNFPVLALCTNVVCNLFRHLCSAEHSHDWVVPFALTLINFACTIYSQCRPCHLVTWPRMCHHISF